MPVQYIRGVFPSSGSAKKTQEVPIVFIMFSLPDQKTQLKCFDQNMTSVCSRHIRSCLLC